MLGTPVKKLIRLKYDNFLIPLIGCEEVEYLKTQMKKREFNKLIALENKKRKINEGTEKFSVEYEKKRKEINAYYDTIQTRDETIRSLENTKFSFNDLTYREMDNQISSIRNQISNLRFGPETKYIREIESTIIPSLKNTLKKSLKKFKRNFEIGRFDIVLREKNEGKADSKNVKNSETLDELNLLKRLDKLPDELLSIIRSYFTYETRTNIISKSYIDGSILKEFLAPGIRVIKYRIFNDYRTKMRIYRELFKEMSRQWVLFHDTPHFLDGVFKGTLNQERLYIEYLFFLFRKFGCHQWLYEIFRNIHSNKEKLIKKTSFP